MKTKLLQFILAGLMLIMVNLSNATHLGDELLISAKLTGLQENPAVNTEALGVGSLVLNNTWDTLSINISVNGLSGPITGIHIHEGDIGTNGGVVINLSDFVVGNRVITKLTGDALTLGFISNLLSGKLYLNVHTEENAGGEIRGQLNLEKDWGFRTSLNGDQQVPPLATSATGVGYFNLSHDKTFMEIKVVTDGLSGPITAAHLHLGEAGVSGGVEIDLTGMINGNTINGNIVSGISSDLLESMLAGNIYINVHTATNPAGEIRGQLSYDKGLAFDSWLTPEQQVNIPMTTTGVGAAFLSLNTTLDTLWYDIQATNLSGPITASHIHDGAFGTAGGVLVNLSNDISDNRIVGMITGTAITSDLVSDLLSGNTYINIHTAENAGGEIRGQAYRLAREGYTIALEGNESNPSIFTLAKGGGLVSIDRNQTNIHFMMVVSDLSGPMTAAHFHNAAFGQNGGVIFDLADYFSLSNTNDAAFGYWKNTDANPFTIAQSLEFRNENVYVNIHTEQNPSGEVRSQVYRGLKCFEHQLIENGDAPLDPNFDAKLLFTAKLTGSEEVPSVDTDALGVAGFLLNATRDTIKVNINVDGLSGPITGAHIHEGNVGENGGVVINFIDMISENQISGFITDFDINKFITGAYYVNVHTANNPGGEIRGQVGFETDWTLIADMNGDQTVPNVTTSAYGLGVFNLAKNNSKLEIRIVSTGLSGPITAAHLHMGEPGTSGGVVQNLSDFITDNGIIANVDPSAYLEALKNGELYVNIHTEANPSGEIRGQLLLTNTFTFDSWLNGAQENPEAQTPAKGVAVYWMNATWDSLYYDVVIDNLSGPITASHIHNAAIGINGGVDVNLGDDIMENRISGVITGDNLSDELITKLITGQSYINVHTTAFPGGEVRGQVLRLARDGFTYEICGNQEVPAVSVNGYGGGILSIDRNHMNAHVMFTSTALTGDITGAHIHDAPINEAGGVLYGLTDILVNNSGFTYLEIDAEGAEKIKSGGTYLNIHTENNPGGEIRGQIDHDVECPAVITATYNLESDYKLNLFPNPVTRFLKITLDNKDIDSIDFKIYDIVGNIFHEGSIDSIDSVISIDLESLSSGVYFVNFINENGQFVKKIIKR